MSDQPKPWWNPSGSSVIPGFEGDGSPPIPLRGELPPAPPFPTDVLPERYARMVREVAAEMDAPEDLPGCLVLALAAAALANVVNVQIRPGYVEPAQRWVATTADVGEGKSPIFRRMIEQLRHIERTMRDAEEENIELAMREKDLKEAHAKFLKDKAKKNPDAEDGEGHTFADLFMAAAAAAAEINVPPAPIIFTSGDLTPETIPGLLEDAPYTRMAILSDEGGILQMSKRYGRKDVGANLDALLHGHSGGDIKVHRVGRPPEIVYGAAITVGIFIQPVLLDAMLGDDELAGRGYVARMDISFPEPHVGRRTFSGKPVSYQTQQDYAAGILDLFKVMPDANGDPHVLPLSPEAVALIDAWRLMIEPRLLPGADLHAHRAWLNKQHGNAARIALALHMLEYGQDGITEFGPVDNPGVLTRSVEAPVMEKAIKFVEYYLAHRQRAVSFAVDDPMVELAERVVHWIRKNHLMEITERDAFTECRRSKDMKVTEFRPVFKLLNEHQYLRAPLVDSAENVRDAYQTGRKPSQSWQVNPRVHD